MYTIHKYISLCGIPQMKLDLTKEYLYKAYIETSKNPNRIRQQSKRPINRIRTDQWKYSRVNI